MRHLIKTLSVALAAVFVFGAIAAASASATQPKFEPEGGAFPVTFEGSGGAGVLEVLPEGTKKRTVSCTSNTSAGNLGDSTTVKEVVVKFKECSTSGPFGEKVPCGEIVTTKLKGKLYYLTAGSSEVGVDFEPETAPEFAKFVCKNFLVNETLTVTGSVVGKLTPVNTSTTKFTLKFNQTEGHQEPLSLLNSTCEAKEATLMTTGSGSEAFGPRQSGIKGEESVTTAKAVTVTSTKC
jgi:hypothetical protein